MNPFTHHIMLAAALSLAVSCSVKEDRVPCPCYLNVSFRGDAEDVGITARTDAEAFRERIPDTRVCDPYWVKPLRKGIYTLSAWKGVRECREAGRFLLIGEGSQCDSLYTFFTEVDATGEMAYAEAEFRKQFATVTVDLCREEWEMGDFTFLVRGNTRGVDLFSHDPVPGEFRFSPVPIPGKSTISFRAPRQGDDSMPLTLTRLGEGAGTYPLGEYIRRVGYDWTEADLRDVHVLIDLVIGLVTVRVEGWEDGAVFSLIKQ